MITRLWSQSLTFSLSREPRLGTFPRFSGSKGELRKETSRLRKEIVRLLELSDTRLRFLATLRKEMLGMRKASARLPKDSVGVRKRSDARPESSARVRKAAVTLRNRSETWI